MTERALTRSDNYPRLSEVQETILERILEGDSVNTICKEAGMPSKSTVFRWLSEDGQFLDGYKIAKALYAETLFEEALEIVDAPPPMIVTTDGQGVTETRVDSGAVQHAKLRLDARKWACGKLSPRRFGDSALLRIGDAGGGMSSEAHEISGMEMFTRLAAIAAKAGKGGD